jgi:cytochrome c oxidase cbb3-type subunit III
MTLKGIAVAAFFVLPALPQHGSTTVVNPYIGPEDQKAGAALFRSQCAGCHGPDGNGTGAGPNIASGRLPHGDSDEAVFRTISKGLPGTSMPGFSFSGLQIWQLVTHLRALAIARGAAHATGNPKAGAAMFAANCVLCHSTGGEGGLDGPDLSTIGTLRSYNELRESLLDPDAQVDSPYWSVAAVTSTGKSIRGVRLNEDSFSVQIRDGEGRLQSLLKRDLKSMDVIRRSPMPSFKGKLSDAQIDDVIAWLVNGRQQ